MRSMNAGSNSVEIRNHTERFYNDKVYETYWPKARGYRVPLRYSLVVAHIRSLPQRPGLVVEIGPETAETAMFLTHELGLGVEGYWAIDVSSRAVQSLVDSGIRATAADASRDAIPLCANVADVVVMNEVIEHLLDPDFALEQARRVLKRSGVLIITTPNLAAWFNRLILLAGLQPLYTETGTEWVLGRGRFAPRGRPVGHVHLFTKGSLSGLLDLHGFKIEKLRGMPLEVRQLRSGLPMAIDRLFSRVPALAAGFFVVARPRE